MRRKQAYNLSRSGYDTLDEYEMDICDFADPGGRSALRAATSYNPRNRPCPQCHEPNVLTPADVALGYCCNRCADHNEGNYGCCSYGDY